MSSRFQRGRAAEIRLSYVLVRRSRYLPFVEGVDSANRMGTAPFILLSHPVLAERGIDS
jgi:hypothetical protein